MDHSTTEDDEILEHIKKPITLKAVTNLFTAHKLIELVKERPLLWDKMQEGFNSSKTRQMQLWYQICNEIIPNFRNMNKTTRREIAELVITKWRNTRDSYKKSKTRNRSYVYENLLTFLDPTMDIVRRDDVSKRFALCDETVDYNFKAEEEEFLDEEYINTEDPIDEENSQSYIEAQKIVGHKQRDNLEERERNPLVFQDILREDEDQAFFNCIMPSVKKLSHQDKMEFRIGVLGILKNFTPVKDKDRDPLNTV